MCFYVMRIKVVTAVKASLKAVKEGFTGELFLKLNPPFPPVKLIQFDGSKKGDKVELELNFLLFKQRWVSEITEDGEDSNQWYFIDEGTGLPFFLKRWKHRHVVKKLKTGSIIVDDICYSTGSIITDFIFYPLLFGQFLYRKPVYKKTFQVL